MALVRCIAPLGGQVRWGPLGHEASNTKISHTVQPLHQGAGCNHESLVTLKVQSQSIVVVPFLVEALLTEREEDIASSYQRQHHACIITGASEIGCC